MKIWFYSEDSLCHCGCAFPYLTLNHFLIISAKFNILKFGLFFMCYNPVKSAWDEERKQGLVVKTMDYHSFPLLPQTPTTDLQQVAKGVIFKSTHLWPDSAS